MGRHQGGQAGGQAIFIALPPAGTGLVVAAGLLGLAGGLGFGLDGEGGTAALAAKRALGVGHALFALAAVDGFGLLADKPLGTAGIVIAWRAAEGAAVALTDAGGARDAGGQAGLAGQAGHAQLGRERDADVGAVARGAADLFAGESLGARLLAGEGAHPTLGRLEADAGFVAIAVALARAAGRPGTVRQGAVDIVFGGHVSGFASVRSGVNSVVKELRVRKRDVLDDVVLAGVRFGEALGVRHDAIAAAYREYHQAADA